MDYFNKRIVLHRKIIHLVPEDKKKWQYKTISRDNPIAKERIDSYTQRYLHNSGNKVAFQQVLEEEACFRERLYGTNHSYKHNQMADLEYRLGNRLLKELKVQLEEKNKLRSVSRTLQKTQKENVTSEIRFTLRDRRRLDRAMGDTYQKKVNLLYYEQTEREAELARHKQEYGLE